MDEVNDAGTVGGTGGSVALVWTSIIKCNSSESYGLRMPWRVERVRHQCGQPNVEITERIAVLVDLVKLVWNDDMFK